MSVYLFVDDHAILVSGAICSLRSWFRGTESLWLYRILVFFDFVVSSRNIWSIDPDARTDCLAISFVLTKGGYVFISLLQK